MASTIPFDPSLVIGNIVSQTKITDLENIANLQKPVDAAQRDLDAMILSKRSLDMTMQEMINMNVDLKDLTALATEIDKLKSEMAKAAVALADEVVKAQKAIKQARDQQGQKQIQEEIESPIDYNSSEIKQMPLSSDSMVMDAQYFRFESNKQTQEAHSSSVASYVSGQVSGWLSPTYAAQTSAAIKRTADAQLASHDIQGTLVVTANCTHKIVDIFAPFVLDPEKGIRAWNTFKQNKKIDVFDDASMHEAIQGPDATKAGMKILSGATYGSSFVGLVHILHDENTDQSSSSSDFGAKLSSSIEENLIFSNMRGKFGLSTEFANTVNNLLSTSNLQSHASLVTMGIIPSIASNKVTTAVQTLDPDPQKVMGQLAAIQGFTEGAVNGNASSAQTAKAGESFMQLNNSYVKEVVSALGQQDVAQNEVIDTNSMMTAFDDYVRKAIKGGCGVPINFFLKPITSRQLAEAYLNKFYPGKLIGESSGGSKAKGPVATNQDQPTG